MTPQLLLLLVLLPAAQQTSPAQPALRLEDFETVALAKNPTLAQAAAIIRSAQGRTRQAGAYPNPIIGVTNDDLSYGPIIRGGEWGVFVEQTIVLGRKLGLSRRASEQEVIQAQAQSEAQRLRVMNSIRSLFYQTLAAQRKVEVRERLLNVFHEAVTTSRQLLNVGQADLPDVLEIEIEEQQAELSLISARNELRQVWTQLASMIGEPNREIQRVEGDLDAIPQLDATQLMATLLRDSPELKAANAGVVRAEYLLTRAQREPVPDVKVRAGVHYNRELLEEGRRPIGTQGSLEVGIQLPIFNRNQGGVESARADLERAHREAERVSLSLRSRLAAAIRRYEDTFNLVQRYREQMLPRARRAYDLYVAGVRQMAAAYPQALIARRTLLQLEEEYDDALGEVWATVVSLQGLLLEGGLSAPGIPLELESETRPSGNGLNRQE